GEPGPTLVLCAHLDTVGTAGMEIPPFEPSLEDGRLYGRGSYDMKGAAAAAMSAAAALARERFRGRLLLALVADEEYASLGAAECGLKTERGTVPGETPEQVAEELRAVIRSAGEEAEVENLLDRAPLTCERDAPIARCVRQAAATVTGREPRETGVPYWMDAA